MIFIRTMSYVAIQRIAVALSAPGETPPEEFKISIATHPSGSQIILDDEYGDNAIFRNHHGTQYALFCEDHVISFLSPRT